ncbi:efflux RND transporter periplasmic adaptor subunit [Zooshikella harenae]|uniref:HlyD family efflux transporter periplasmic adaptor subunit n=1 Tax=Zooshikella harenae TaxID=2827238 RepID=A0ABS5ZIW6_9GAMM|nr:HlyD family efflux transporter periplasmic adaptor subunit [Zooshikella harenae]MBU2713870.1 HlyD family efflux transporter periplasmic adaptor subunit [Zooshikella harenae]
MNASIHAHLKDTPPPRTLPVISCYHQFISTLYEQQSKETIASQVTCPPNQLLNYDLILFIGYKNKQVFVYGVSHSHHINQKAPLIHAARKLIQAELMSNKHSTYSIDQVSDQSLQATFKKSGLNQFYWSPFNSQNKCYGGLLYCRNSPWCRSDEEMIQLLNYHYLFLVEQHHFGSLKTSDTSKKRTIKYLSICTTLILLMILPIRLSVLAPAEIVPQTPIPITSPLTGIISKVLVKPNQLVTQGDILYQYEPVELKNNYQIKLEQLQVAESRYKTALQNTLVQYNNQAFAQQQAEYELAKAQLNLAKEQLAFTHVTAPKDGVILFGDTQALIGKPVTMGERIMYLSDPNDTELSISLGVQNFTPLKKGNEVLFFRNAEATTPISAKLTSISYFPDVKPGVGLNYPLRAQLTINNNEFKNEQVRIGLQGTAKVYGEQVTLFYYLFRRPLTAARQWLGL